MSGPDVAGPAQLSHDFLLSLPHFRRIGRIRVIVAFQMQESVDRVKDQLRQRIQSLVARLAAGGFRRYYDFTGDSLIPLLPVIKSDHVGRSIMAQVSSVDHPNGGIIHNGQADVRIPFS